MTDHSALIERLEERSEVFCRVGKSALANDLTEAAACIREMASKLQEIEDWLEQLNRE